MATWSDHGVPRDRNQWLREPARRRRRIRILLAAIAGSACLASAAGALYAWRHGLDGPRRLLHQTFALRTLSVEGARRVPAGELVAASGLRAGTPIYAIDVAAAAAALEGHPWVDSARVARMPPSVVILHVVERDPVAVAAADGALPFLVDGSGLPFAPAEPDDVTTLPWIVAPHPVRLGEATPELARGAALTRALRERTLAEGAEVHVAPEADAEGLSLLLPGLPGRVVFGTGGLPEKLERLARLRAARLPELAEGRVIDLRFAERAVLRSETPAPGADTGTADGAGRLQGSGRRS